MSKKIKILIAVLIVLAISGSIAIIKHRVDEENRKHEEYLARVDHAWYLSKLGQGGDELVYSGDMENREIEFNDNELMMRVAYFNGVMGYTGEEAITTDDVKQYYQEYLDGDSKNLSNFCYIVSGIGGKSKPNENYEGNSVDDFICHVEFYLGLLYGSKRNYTTEEREEAIKKTMSDYEKGKYKYVVHREVDKTIKIDIDNIGMKTAKSFSVDTFDGNYVYYSDHIIYLNDHSIKYIDENTNLGDIAMDSKYIYYIESNEEENKLIRINQDRDNREEEVILSSDKITLIKFEEELLVIYGENNNEIAKIVEGKLDELGNIENNLESDNTDTLVREVEIDNYKFVYLKKNFQSDARLCYIKNNDEIINFKLDGANIVKNGDKLYSTDDLPIADYTYIKLPDGNETDQSLLSWDEYSIYIISVQGAGSEKVNYSYDMKKSETLYRYDFKTGKLYKLNTMTPSEEQIIGISVEKRKLYTLSNNKVIESTLQGYEYTKELGEIPEVDSIYVEICGDKLFIFSDNELIESFDI